MFNGFFTKEGGHKWLVLLLALVLLLGFLAGIAGEVFARNFIFNYLANKQELGDLNNKFIEILKKYDFLTQDEKQGPLEVVIRRSGEGLGINTIRQIEAGSTMEGLRQGTVDFFIVNNNKVAGDVLLDSYLPQNRLGQGFILTSDGWLVTTNQVVDASRKNYSVVTSDGQVYAVQKMVSDPLTAAVFVKIDAKNLPVLNYNKDKKVNIGDTVVLRDTKGGLKISTVENNFYRPGDQLSDLVSSSEAFNNYYLLSTDISDVVLGGVAADAANNIIGLVVSSHSQKIILPSSYFAGIVDGVLRDGQVLRPYLGVDYLDLDQLTLNNPLYPNYKNISSGALIYFSKQFRARGVVAASPAAIAELKNGDVILKVEGRELGDGVSLSQLIQGYKAGTEINLSVMSQGQEKNVKVKLGELLLK